DGTGYGTDGTVWGGEFLVAEYATFRRAAHLRYVGMPGGEQAIREPWRMALAHLRDAEVDGPGFTARFSPLQLRALQRMLDRRFNSPLTSSAGRLFDAVAALLGIRDRVSYEGQAAIEMEWLATTTGTAGSYSFEVNQQPAAEEGAPLVVDTRPLIRALT